MEENKEKPKAQPIVEVDSKQIFTADFVFKQMQYQSSRIDKAKSIATIALVIAAISIVVSYYAITN
mgnify:CR=1 FL=1|jgi:hypothetical protein